MAGLSVSEAVASRRSVRAFLSNPVDREVIADILNRALRAPSGGNLQPWWLYVLHGESMARFRALMETRLAQLPNGEPAEYAVYPQNLPEPYRGRRYDVGEAMYDLLGIPRGEKVARLGWVQNNFRFFGAPAAVFCFTDRMMDRPQWSDLGMMLQTAMLLFQEAGLATCAQEAWSRWPKTIAEFVDAPSELMLFCGLAIGYADPTQPVNNLIAKRDSATVTFV